MRQHLLGIDHVVILTHDLERARDVYARLDFTLTPSGYHTLGSQNHCVMFGNDYLELMAVPRAHPALQYYTDFLAAGEGLAAVALATDDANGAQAGLRGGGIPADPPLDFSARCSSRTERTTRPSPTGRTGNFHGIRDGSRRPRRGTAAF